MVIFIREIKMKKVLSTIAVAGMLASSATFASAASMDDMSGMMACSASCTTEYMQCVAAANQLTSDPAMAMSQIKSNMMASTECGNAAMACSSSCK